VVLVFVLEEFQHACEIEARVEDELLTIAWLTC
jgi:hypothetical protein